MGDIALRRRYWKCTCGGDGLYAVDALLGVEGERTTKLVQKHCCRLGADKAFAQASETLQEMWGVALCPETIRTLVEGHGKKMVAFQAQDTASEMAFQKAKGEVEFTTDAGKVNTREQGWKDLKIAVVSKREAGKPTPLDQVKQQRLPAATCVLAIALIATIKEFRKGWRPWLRRLGVRCLASVSVLGDGASWIWKAAGRVLTGCQQTLDFWHACQRVHKCAERIFGEDTQPTKSAYQRGKELLLAQGWPGVCCWVSELLGMEEETERERRRKATDKLIGYFSKHTQRLNYAERLSSGRAIGSGQVEGQAKTLGLRLKARGARWKFGNVEAMASLVCVRNSSQWSEYWHALAV